MTYRRWLAAKYRIEGIGTDATPPPFDYVKHDKAHHGGCFDPNKMTCKFRSPLGQRNIWDKDVEGIRKNIESASVARVSYGAFHKNEGMSIQKTAMLLLNAPKTYSTPVGNVTIDKRSAHDSLAHGYSQKKLDTLVSIQKDFANAVYLGSALDFEGKDIVNHYFAYPIAYGDDGERNIVFCRAREDINSNRLYLHEVVVEEAVKNMGDAFQTAAASSPRDASHTNASPEVYPKGVSLAHIILNRIFNVNREDEEK